VRGGDCAPQVPIANSRLNLWLFADAGGTLHLCLALAGTGSTMLRLSESLRTVLRQDGAVILDVAQGKIVRCNRTAATILELVSRGYDQAQITAEFRRRYEISAASAEADVGAFLIALERQGLLSHDTAAKPGE
jgi:Coenzyme PQQ synthesis protein D (PqqD)